MTDATSHLPFYAGDISGGAFKFCTEIPPTKGIFRVNILVYHYVFKQTSPHAVLVLHEPCWSPFPQLRFVPAHLAAGGISDVCPLVSKYPNEAASHLQRSLDLTWQCYVLPVTAPHLQKETDPGRGSWLRWGEENIFDLKWHNARRYLLQQRPFKG